MLVEIHVAKYYGIRHKYDINPQCRMTTYLMNSINLQLLICMCLAAMVVNIIRFQILVTFYMLRSVLFLIVVFCAYLVSGLLVC